MKISEIYTAYVSWGTGGKRRPILIVETEEKAFSFLNVTTKYAQKSPKIKKLYYPLQDWDKEGLNRQSYIDTGNLLRLFTKDATLTYVGQLTTRDKLGLAKFINGINK